MNANNQGFSDGFVKVSPKYINIREILLSFKGQPVPEWAASLHIDFELDAGTFHDKANRYWRACWNWSFGRVQKLLKDRGLLLDRPVADHEPTTNRPSNINIHNTCDSKSTNNRPTIDHLPTEVYKDQTPELNNLPISFLAEGIGVVKATCKELGPLPDNAKAVHQAIGNALKRKGMDVQWEVTVEDRGDGYRGRIDLVATWKGSSIGIEIDRLSPREKSIFKLLGSGCHGKVVVLRGAEAIDPPDGIDAVFSVQVQEEPELELGTPKPPPEPPKPDRKSTEFPIPEGIHLPAWKRWTEFRRTVKRKPVSYAAAVIQFKELLLLTPEQQMEAVEYSIGADYQKLVVPYSVRKEAERTKVDNSEPKMLNLITGRMG